MTTRDTHPSANNDTLTEIDRDRRIARVRRHIVARPQDLFDVVANPALHPLIDGSGTVVAENGDNPERLAPGERFGMSMRYAILPYPIRNRVVEFEEGHRIAWRHFAGHRWRWEFESADGGTMVVHSFDWSTSRWPWALELVGYPERNAAGMAGTLSRLEDHVTANGAG